VLDAPHGGVSDRDGVSAQVLQPLLEVEMLTERQRRELAAIEHRISAENPELAQMLSFGRLASRPVLAARVLGSPRLRWMIFGTLMVLAGAVGLGMVAVVLGLIVLVVAAAFMAPGRCAPGPPRARPADRSPEPALRGCRLGSSARV
jgi:hypothetical protein